MAAAWSLLKKFVMCPATNPHLSLHSVLATRLLPVCTTLASTTDRRFVRRDGVPTLRVACVELGRSGHVNRQLVVLAGGIVRPARTQPHRLRLSTLDRARERELRMARTRRLSGRDESLRDLERIA